MAIYNGTEVPLMGGVLRPDRGIVSGKTNVSGYSLGLALFTQAEILGKQDSQDTGPPVPDERIRVYMRNNGWLCTPHCAQRD